MVLALTPLLVMSCATLVLTEVSSRRPDVAARLSTCQVPPRLAASAAVCIVRRCARTRPNVYSRPTTASIAVAVMAKSTSTWPAFVGRAVQALRRYSGCDALGRPLVEFALAITVFMLLVLGTFDLARAYLAYTVVTNAAREARRYGAAHLGDPARRAGMPSRLRLASTWRSAWTRLCS